jgi:hypothetical protein
MLIVGLQVLTPVVTHNFIFWDITLCSPMEESLRFGGNVASIVRVEE